MLYGRGLGRDLSHIPGSTLKRKKLRPTKCSTSLLVGLGRGIRSADFQTVSEGSLVLLKIITAALIASAPVVLASAREKLLISPSSKPHFGSV